MIIEFHRNMLTDTARNAAFYAALQQVIVPGETVIADIGSGTGLLAFMAIRLGAKAAYLYEYSDALVLSQQLAEANHIPNLHFFHGHSTDVVDPVPVDVVISETLGNYAYEENIIETIADAKRFLKPGGSIIPQRIEQYVAPVSSDRFQRELTGWDHVGYDLDFSIAKQLSLNNIYVRTVQPGDLLQQAGAMQTWDTIDLATDHNSVRKRQVQWHMDNDAPIHGFAFWWNCELVPGVVLATSPFEKTTHWEQLYFPLQESLVLERGQVLRLDVESDTRYDVGVNLAWSVTQLSATGNILSTQTMNMQNGFI